jgi:hypothetical protein
VGQDNHKSLTLSPCFQRQLPGIKQFEPEIDKRRNQKESKESHLSSFYGKIKLCSFQLDKEELTEKIQKPLSFKKSLFKLNRKAENVIRNWKGKIIF